MAVMSNKRTLYLAFGCVMPEIKGRLRDHVGYIIGRLRDETMRHRASKHKDLVMKTFARSLFFFSFLSYVTCFFFLTYPCLALHHKAFISLRHMVKTAMAELSDRRGLLLIPACFNS